MAFITNITNPTPDSGVFDPDGNPLGINNDGGLSLTGSSVGSDSANNVYPYVESISEPNISTLLESGYYSEYTNSYRDVLTKDTVNPTVLPSGVWSISNSEETFKSRTYKTDQTNNYSVTFFTDGGPENRSVPERFDTGACPCPVAPGFLPLIPTTLTTKEWDGQEQVNIAIALPKRIFSGVACTRFGGAGNIHKTRGPGYWLVDQWGTLTHDLDIGKAVETQAGCISGAAKNIDRYLQNNILGRNCAYRANAIYRGTDLSGIFGGTGIAMDEQCEPQSKCTVYEGTECSIGGMGTFYDRAGHMLVPVEPALYSDDACCKNTTIRSLFAQDLLNEVHQNFCDKHEHLCDAWNQANSGVLDVNGTATEVFYTGSPNYVDEFLRLDVNRFRQTRCEALRRMENVWVVIPTGGGGPGSGDNILPYWDSGQCDWIVALRQQEIVCTGEPKVYHPLFAEETGICCTTLSGVTPGFDEPEKPRGTFYTSCPTGAIIKLKSSEITRIAGCSWWPGFIQEVNWPACLAGCGSGSGSCAAIDARGPLYANLSYVCYDDGAGHTGNSWIVQSSEFVGDPTCKWMYSIDFYGGDPPAPSGYPVTGIFETGLAC
jgi:hypothetical protein